MGLGRCAFDQLKPVNGECGVSSVLQAEDHTTLSLVKRTLQGRMGMRRKSLCHLADPWRLVRQ
jgi:hypothetical protein